MSNLMHTHYDPYGPPRSVEGTLLDCDDAKAHDPKDSELWAEYMYSPQLGPLSATGLPPLMVASVLTAYMRYRAEDTVKQITDVTADPEYTYRVKITNRTGCNGDGPTWHTEEWGLHADGQWRSTYNPHPGYEHWPTSCPNCGY